jgi:hypothetical protein
MVRRLLHAKSAPKLFVLLFVAAYVVLPAEIAGRAGGSPYFLQLAWMCALAAVFVVVGAMLPLPLHRMPKVRIPMEVVLAIVWVAFLAYAVAVCATAEGIPLLASLHGADQATITTLRENFLKARVGWQAGFVYMNAIFAGFLLPYCIALMFLHRVRFRWLCFLGFLLYSLSFVEKAFFLKAVVPLFYLALERRLKTRISPGFVCLVAAGLLVGVTVASRIGATDGPYPNGTFFSTNYVPGSPLEYMVWRSVSVPVTTATDAIRVFKEQFDGKLLLGRTSSLVAKATGSEQVPFERTVFEQQWGQLETGTGSSNSVYVTEAYVNFGLAGVAAFSLFVGVVLRLFAKSRDVAFQSIWMLFCLNIFTAGVMGTLLSNGFLLVLLMTMFMKMKTPPHRMPKKASGTARLEEARA